ncbi:PPE family protein [Mycobacterium seoulense]|uniref:PPE family protein n=1 Tax=Mycobacterium seoulense TaxID=386911 RepID=UPI003CE7F9B4
MDFGTLPPEVNTARMYSGPGAGPLLTAAATWQRLADHLRDAATNYLILAGLLDGLRGPAAVQLDDSTAPYVRWLHATAALAEQTAARAGAAADAYEWALAATVPPETIAANRSLRTSMVARNRLGHHTPAIAAAEGHYDQMWAQDAATMYAYAAAAAQASTLTPFTSPPAADDDEVIAAGAELVSMLPAALNGLSSPSVGGAAATAGRGRRAAVLAHVGRGVSVGGLSVPQAWWPAAGVAPARRGGGAPLTHSGL